MPSPSSLCFPHTLAPFKGLLAGGLIFGLALRGWERERERERQGDCRYATDGNGVTRDGRHVLVQFTLRQKDIDGSMWLVWRHVVCCVFPCHGTWRLLVGSQLVEHGSEESSASCNRRGWQMSFLIGVRRRPCRWPILANDREIPCHLPAMLWARLLCHTWPASQLAPFWPYQTTFALYFAAGSRRHSSFGHWKGCKGHSHTASISSWCLGGTGLQGGLMWSVCHSVCVNSWGGLFAYSFFALFVSVAESREEVPMRLHRMLQVASCYNSMVMIWVMISRFGAWTCMVFGQDCAFYDSTAQGGADRQGRADCDLLSNKDWSVVASKRTWASCAKPNDPVTCARCIALPGVCHEPSRT